MPQIRGFPFHKIYSCHCNTHKKMEIHIYFHCRAIFADSVEKLYATAEHSTAELLAVEFGLFGNTNQKFNSTNNMRETIIA